jgi:DNA-binding transcriptional LysR family regulator
MELRQLEYLVAVAEEANFTRAAERVHISQSGVSAQVRSLERELGATLFDRSGRTANLTTAGAAALVHARAALASVDAMRKAVDDVNGVVRGRLVVGMVVGCRVTPLFEALAAFHADHPGVEVELVEDNSAALIERVRIGEVDLALIASAGARPPDLNGFTIVSEKVIAVVHPEHPLARRRRVTIADLSTYPIVCLPPGTGIRTAFDQVCAAQGVEVTVAFEASAPDTVADLAARGLGVAVLSESTAPRSLHRLAIRDAAVPATLAVTWAGATNPALERLVHHCRAAFAPPSGEPQRR